MHRNESQATFNEHLNCSATVRGAMTGEIGPEDTGARLTEFVEACHV